MDPMTTDNGLVVNNLNHVRSESQSQVSGEVPIDDGAKHVCCMAVPMMLCRLNSATTRQFRYVS